MTNEERRQDVRHKTVERKTTIQLVSGSTKGQGDSIPIIVNVENISISGICIITTQPLELGQALHFPDETIQKDGIIVWTYQSQEEYKSGIKFE